MDLLRQAAAERPDFGRAATFFVLPGASKPNRLFNQPEHEGKKLRWLVSQGYEIGNHTLWHANLGKYDEPTVRGQIAESARIEVDVNGGNFVFREVRPADAPLELAQH